TLNLTPGVATSATNFFTATPSASCGTSSSCASPNYTQIGTLTASFSFTETVSHATASLTQSGTYEAKYQGSALACTSSPAGKTDCIFWTALPYNAATATVTDLVTFTNGDVLKVTLYKAEDWAITPTISFQLLTTPLPGALPLFGSVIGGGYLF